MLISVVLNGVTKFLDDGITPYVEGGEPGYMDTDELELKTYKIETENEITEAIEYWEGNQLRHRSVNMFIKQSLASSIEQMIFG